MKHLLLFSLLLALSFKSKSQVDSSLRKILCHSGIELIKYQRQVTLGTTLQIVGALVVAGGSTADATANRSVIGVGAGIAVIGFFISATAAAHIKKAGILMQGNGIVISFGGRKRK